MEVIKKGKAFDLAKAGNNVYWILQNGKKTNQFWFSMAGAQACFDRLNGLN